MNRSPLYIKKLYVLAAQELEQTQLLSKAITKDTQVEELNEVDLKFQDSPWRGAEAYHFLMLAQRQLYNGNVESALKTVSLS